MDLEKFVLEGADPVVGGGGGSKEDWCFLE